MRAEWKNAVDFAEVAEAIGINTSQIMAAANPASGSLVVFYTDEMADDISREEMRETLIYAVVLRRGSDDILFVASKPQIRKTADLMDEIDERMREHFGDPS